MVCDVFVRVLKPRSNELYFRLPRAHAEDRLRLGMPRASVGDLGEAEAPRALRLPRAGDLQRLRASHVEGAPARAHKPLRQVRQ